MYLVDDVLYKKITQSEINPAKPSTQTANTLFKTSTDFKNQPSPSSIPNILTPSPPNPEINITALNPSPSPPPDTYMDYSNNAVSNQPPLQQSGINKPDENKDGFKRDEVDTPGTTESACACFNPVKPNKKQIQDGMKASPQKRNITRNEPDDEDKPSPKRSRMNPLKDDVSGEEEYDWDNDPEISEMRDRFNKIKYDINYPPPKEPISKKTKKGKNVKNAITYLCSICDTYFKYRHQLSHHISVNHPSFSQADEEPTSSVNQPPKPSNIKKKQILQLKRGTKRKSTQEKPTHKKMRTDGRQKRKSYFQDPPTKQRKSEIECRLCHSFLKSEKALRRHEKNVHNFPKDNEAGLKRKRNEPEFSGSYDKRHKTQPLIPVLYQNYFV